LRAQDRYHLCELVGRLRRWSRGGGRGVVAKLFGMMAGDLSSLLGSGTISGSVFSVDASATFDSSCFES